MRRAMVLTFVLFLAAMPAIRAGQVADTHRQAAVALLQVMGAEKTMLVGATTMVDAMIQGNSALAPYRETLLTWIERHLTWDNVAPRFSELYVQTFEEAELRQLIAFYKTPTGQKSLRELPGLMQRGSEIGVAIAQEHTDELEQMILARAAELEGAAPPQ